MFITNTLLRSRALASASSNLKRPVFTFQRTLWLFNKKKAAESPQVINPTLLQQHQHQQRDDAKTQRKTLIFRSVLAITIGLSAFVLYAWPRHTFPSSVAKELRKGLWEEREKNKDNHNRPNHQKALEYYISALNRAKEEELDTLSDEYTGIELKIAEMYEKLNMIEAASKLYLELSYRYYTALNDPENPHGIKTMERGHYIQKDLRVLIKFVQNQMNSKNVDLAVLNFNKRLLTSHIIMAEKEVFMKSTELPEKYMTQFRNDMLKKKSRSNEFAAKLNIKGYNFQPFENVVDENNIHFNKDGYMELDLNQKSSYAWDLFKSEFFVARDLYSAICLSTKDVPSAIYNKMNTLNLMVLAGMEPGQILMTQANLGSLLYLRVEQMEDEMDFMERNPEKFKELLANKTENTDDQLIQVQRLMNRARDVCFKSATECYESIIKFSSKHKRLKFNYKDLADTNVGQAIALSKYGLGVLRFHEGNLQEAKILLNDGKQMASEIAFTDLVNEADNELAKLNKAMTAEQQKQSL